MLKNRYLALSKLEKRAFWIAVILTFLFSIFASTELDTFMSSTALRERLGSGAPLSMAFVALVCTILFLAGRVTFASWGLQIATILILSANVTLVEGFGFVNAFIILAVTLFIPVQTLKGRSASTALWVGLAGVLGVIILDTFWVGSRIPALAEDELFASILAIILSLVLVSTALTQFASFTLRTKLLLLTLGTGLISILVVAMFTIAYTQRTLTLNTRNALASAATRTMDDIDGFIALNVLSVSDESRLPELATFLKAPDDVRGNTNSDILVLFNKLSQRNPGYTSSYSLLDRTGIVLVATRTADIGIDSSARDHFLQPKSSGKTFVSPVEGQPSSTDRMFYISAPVVDASGEFLGVLRVQYPFSTITDILERNELLAGENSYSILLEGDNFILAHSTNPGWVYRTLVKPDQAAFLAFENNNKISSDISIDEIGLNMPDFAEKISQVTDKVPYFSSTDEAWGAPVEVGVAGSSANTSLMVAYILPQEISLGAIDRQIQVTVLATLITGLSILLVGFFVTRIITKPLEDLAAVAEEITSGNLSARAQYNINDEVGALANSFNRMTNQLQDTLGGLERRVAERTSDAEIARMLSDRRAQELQTISEISRAISTEQRLEILLPLITRLVSERFDFYHVGIFFVDETRKFAYLQAANSEGGQIMLARRHRLEVGVGLVGTVVQTTKPRIALDVGSDAVFFDNPDLPDTRSEMALPLNFRGQTIGVLDVQSTKPGAFTESDANTLGILADQVAIAIENARLFGQMQKAREESEALYAQIQHQEWNSFAQRESRIGYRQTATGGRQLIRPVKTNEIRTALEKGRIVVLDGREARSLPTIAVPVKLRGQTIGILNIEAPTKDRKWNQDEINLVQAISDRLALALDNARLLQESQRRAAKEAKIGEVSAKIGASINMRNVLQTAVEELGRALPGSEVVIQFQPENDDHEAE